jgi:ubiquinone/menaquinone biosynthesis C-methylase UbiE/uncharacterized protein YbaR (Trm112 family)
MKKTLLKYIECPLCQEDLDNISFEVVSGEINTGLLLCKNNGKHIYPIVNGIPRLIKGAIEYHYQTVMKFEQSIPEEVKAQLNKSEKLGKKYSHIQKSFSSEWGKIDETVRAWGRDAITRRKLFLEWVDISEDQLKGKKILDAGCGNGEVEMGISNTGAELFAIDISFSVDKVWNKIKLNGLQNDFHIVQGNIHELPFKKGVFDIVHSAGVLHHTPDTLYGFKKVDRTLKLNGKAYIEVYSKDHKNLIEKMIFYIDRPIRAVTSRVPTYVLHLLCYLLVPLQWIMVTLIGLFQKGRYIPRTFKEYELSLFDNYSPRYQFHHSTKEVFEWFGKLGYSSIKKTLTNSSVIGIVGVKTRMVE